MTRFVVDASAVLHLASAGIEVSGARAPRTDAPAFPDAVGSARGRPAGRDPGRRRARPPRPHRADADQAPRRRCAPASGLGPGGSAGMGLDLRRRVRRAHAAAGGRVRDPGRGAGAQRRRDRRDRVDRRAALGRHDRPSPGRRSVGCCVALKPWSDCPDHGTGVACLGLDVTTQQARRPDSRRRRRCGCGHQPSRSPPTLPCPAGADKGGPCEPTAWGGRPDPRSPAHA